MIKATLILVTLFYALTLLVSSYGNKFAITKNGKTTLPLGVGIFTMAATWIGGGFINGTAESSYSYGVIATQAPVAYALSMIVGGLLFCTAIYERGYDTFIDPIMKSYGKDEEAFIAMIAIFSEIMWTAAILVALGQSFAIVFEIPGFYSNYYFCDCRCGLYCAWRNGCCCYNRRSTAIFTYLWTNCNFPLFHGRYEL